MHWKVGWREHCLGAEKPETTLLPMPQNPQRPMHVLFGNHEPARTLAIKTAKCLTNKLEPR